MIEMSIIELIFFGYIMSVLGFVVGVKWRTAPYEKKYQGPMATRVNSIDMVNLPALLKKQAS